MRSRAGEVDSKACDVRRRGAAEAVDGLACIADNPQVAAVADDGLQEPDRGAVDILVFIYEHMRMASTQGVSYLGATLDKTDWQRDQVAELQQLARGQQPFVRLEERGNL